MYQLPPNPSFDDVEKLHRQQVPESLILDYKRDPYGNADEDKRELLRDVTSMANADGGHIVLGVGTEGSVPVAIPGVANAGAEVERVVGIIRSGTDPRLSGLDVREKTRNGVSVLIIFVPRSPFGPHMVIFKGLNQYWKRVGTSKQPMSASEVREHCLRTELLRTRLEDFLDHQWDRAIARLRTKGLYLSATPVALEGRAIDVSDPAIRGRLNEFVMPMSDGRIQRWPLGRIRPSMDGIETIGLEDHGTLRLFRNGHIDYSYPFSNMDENPNARVLVDGQVQNRPAFINHKMMLKISGFAKMAKSVHDQAHLVSPIVVQCGLVGAVGTACADAYNMTDVGSCIAYTGPESHIRIPIQYDHDWQPGPVGKEMADRLWNTYHFESCSLLNGEGVQLVNDAR